GGAAGGPPPAGVVPAAPRGRRRRGGPPRLLVGVGEDDPPPAPPPPDRAVAGAAAGPAATDHLESSAVAAVDLELERGHGNPPWFGCAAMPRAPCVMDIRTGRRTSCGGRSVESWTSRPPRNPPDPLPTS